MSKVSSDKAEQAHPLPDAVQPRLTRRLWDQIPQRPLVAVLIFCVALALNLYRLGQPGIWFDEAFSVELARQPLPLLWRIIFGQEPNMELYYLFLHFWLNLTGLFGIHPVEFVVRLPSALFAALSAVVVFLLGQRFISTPGGTVAAALYLLNYLQLTYAQQTRAYSLQLLLLCIAWYALMAGCTCDRQPRRWITIYALSMTLAVYTHLFSVFILLAQVVFFMGLLIVPNSWQQRARQQLLNLLIALTTIIVLCIPMFLVSLQGAKTGWIPAPQRSDLIYLFKIMSGYDLKYLIAIVLCCTLAVLLVIGSSMLPQLIRKSHTPILEQSAVRPWLEARVYLPVCWALLCWFLVPIVVSYAVSHTSLHLFSSRYLVTVVPALCLLIALGVVTIRLRFVPLALALVLLVLAVLPVPLYYRSAQVEDWNSTSHWLLERYQPNDGLVCYDNTLQQGCQISVEYYLHAYPANGAHFTEDAPGAYSWERFGPARAAGPDEAVDPQALAEYGKKHPRLFFIQGRIRDDAAANRARAAQEWLDQHYRLLSKIETRTVTVRIYNTASSQ